MPIPLTVFKLEIYDKSEFNTVQIVHGNCGKDVGLHGGGALVRAWFRHHCFYSPCNHMYSLGQTRGHVLLTYAPFILVFLVD